MTRRATLVFLILAGLATAADPAPQGTVRLTGEVFVAGARSAGVTIEIWRRPGAAPAVPLGQDESGSRHPEWCLETPLLPGPPTAITRTDAEGRFSVEGLEPGRFLVLATAPGGCRGWQNVAALGPDRVEEAEILVKAGPHVLRGRARYRDGTPFRGVILVATHGCAVTEDWATFQGAAVTTEDGRFEIRGLHTGLVWLGAVVPGRLRTSLGTALLPRGEPLDLTVDENLGITSGRVVDPDGLPAAGVRLLAAGDGQVEGGWYDPEVVAEVLTDEDGRFRMLGPLAPEFRVLASDRFLSHVEPRGPADRSLLLVVRPRARVHGIVRSAADGSPVAGVPVLAVDPNDLEMPARTLTDAQGSYVLSLPCPRARLAAWGRGWVPPAGTEGALRLHLSPGAARAIDLEVAPAARLSGRVMDPEGEPVPGAHVELFAGFDRTLYGFAASPLGPITDSSGRFEIRCLPAGSELSIHAGAPGFRGDHVDWNGSDAEVTVTLKARRKGAAGRGRVLLPAGTNRCDLEITRRTADPGTSGWRTTDGRFSIDLEGPTAVGIRGWLDDTFHRGEARLVPGREVEVTLEPAPPENAWLIHVLDPEGRPVPAGDGDQRIVDGRMTRFGSGGEETYEPRVSACRDDRGQPLPYARKVAGPFAPGVHTVRLEPGRVVEGIVVTSDDRPVRGAWVKAYRAHEDPEEWGPVHARARSGIDGRFRLVGLGRYAYRLDTRAPSVFLRSDPVPLAEDATSVRIAVAAKVSARITVVDTEGRPVPGASITLIAPEETGPFEEGRLARTTDAQGVVALPLLSPSLRVALRVEPPGDDLLPRWTWDWSPADGTIRLERSYAITGSVVDAAGQPVADATIFVRPLPGAPPLPEGFSYMVIEGGYVLAAISGEDGRFVMIGLPATRLEIVAVRVLEDGTEQRSPPATTKAGTADLVLRLP